MAELFNIDGHLTNEAFEALIKDENLDELSRLEIAEHLSFCDDCILRYTEYMSDIELKDAPKIEHKIIFEIKKKINRILFSKYSSAVIAASFSIILLVSGIFTEPFEQKDKFDEKPIINQTVQDINNFWEKITQKFNDIDLRGALE